VFNAGVKIAIANVKRIGVDELRVAIEQIVDEMPEVRIPFPAEWFGSI
jgi:hypothetical protein